MQIGETCEKGSLLRPHIVWFGELVPNMDIAATMINDADYFITIGTSLNVYPAAGLIDLAPINIPKYLIDPGKFDLLHVSNLTHIKEKAVRGVEQLKNIFE